MRRVKPSHIQFFALAAGLVIVIWSAPLARADAISFQLSSTALTATTGGTVTFAGTVTNNSGADLNATDFFFNFGNYDFTALTPNQLIGTATNFSIPNGTTATVMDLFNVQLASVLAGSRFLMDVQLEDSNLDLSAVQTVTVNVQGAVNTPEPATVVLLCSGLAAMVRMRRRHRR